ncbi:MAG: hypothetical protein J2P17_04935 [Mycobacterium sp.]|nr:hypothetical protein [Mycobacterium sp.]
MRIEGVDERDSSWEAHQTRFRVYLFSGGDDERRVSWATDTYDITDAEVLDVIRWAQDKAGPDGLYAVALVQEKALYGHRPPSRGLIWLVGGDVHSDPWDERQAHMLAAMRQRRGKAIVANDDGTPA